MTTRDEAEQILKTFAEAHGIAGLCLDENNGAVVEYGEDGALIFEYSDNDNCIVLWAPLFSLAIAESAEAETALLKFLLSRNFPSAQLDGAYLALEEDMGIIVMAKRLHPEPARGAEVVELVNRFLQQARDTTELVSSIDFGNPEHETLNLAKNPEGPAAGFNRV